MLRPHSIAQTHIRHVSPDIADNGRPSNGTPMPSGRNWRGWHTDWPHDLSSYGQGARHAGAIAQPFPPVCMCLTMVWYLTDTDSESGGTWVVPSSHVDLRNPRGPADGINVHAPIPGDMQVRSPHNECTMFVYNVYVSVPHVNVVRSRWRHRPAVFSFRTHVAGTVRVRRAQPSVKATASR